ncbi:MAG: LysM peptidoglycan-binding domain-containing protein [Planktotalea sp.]
MRGIAIFSFFALSTVLIIFLQPGPRPAYVYERSEMPTNTTSRNEVDVLFTPPAKPTLEAPDEVISELKSAKIAQSAAQPEQPQPAMGQNSGSLDRLQSVLTASLESEQVVQSTPDTSQHIASIPAVQPATRAPEIVPAQAVAPELRDMSWQTLNTLNSLGQISKAPGQEGSLLSSIVRRSMGQVDASDMKHPKMPIAATTPARAVSPEPRTGMQTYVVVPGDTLALIAVKLHGSALATDRLLSQNPTLRQNPNALRIGQVLKYSLR